MQTSMGQAASTLNTLLEDMHQYGDDAEGEEVIEARLLQARKELIEKVRNAGDCSMPLNTLLHLKYPVSMKYSQLNVHQLLKDNNESIVQLKSIPVALNMLEKYGRHLLKPPGARVDQWRHIKFNNPIFKERVCPMHGSIAIVQQLGYSAPADCGLQFAQAEPDPTATSNLVADILLARTEMERYLANKHPHPETIHAFLPEATVDQVVEHWDQLSGQDLTVSINPSPSMLHPPTPVSASLPVEGEVQYTSPVQLAELQPTTEMPIGLLSSPTQKEDSLQKACDICGEVAASLWCRHCDNKQLCSACDDMWHKHPKRQNHQRDPIASLPSPSAISQQDAILGPFGIRAVNSMRDLTQSPTPVSGSQSASGYHGNISRTPPPTPSRTPPPQQIESGSPVDPSGGQFGQHPQPGVGPDAKIHMHHQQLQFYQQQMLQMQQQQQQQQQQGGYPASQFPGERFPYHQSQPGLASTAGQTLVQPTVSAQNSAYATLPVQNVGYPIVSSQSSMYPNTSTQNSNFPPFPVLDPDPGSQHPYGEGASPLHPSVSVPQQRIQSRQNDAGLKGMQASAVPWTNIGAAGYSDMSLRQPVQGESGQGIAYPPMGESSMFATTMDRRPSSHLPHRTMSMSSGTPVSESALLKSVLAESNYEKRAAKCDIRLVALEEDLQEVDDLLKELMLSSEDVTECDDFRTLNRRKARLVKEHKALGDYRRELADLMAAEAPHALDPSGRPVSTSQIFHPPPLSTSSSSFDTFPTQQGPAALPVSTSPTQQHLGFSYPHQASQSPVQPQEPVPMSVYHPFLPQSSVQQSVSSTSQGIQGIRSPVQQAGYNIPGMQESSSHQNPINNSSVDQSSILPQWQMIPTVSSASSTVNQSSMYPPPRYQQGEFSNSGATGMYEPSRFSTLASSAHSNVSPMNTGGQLNTSPFNTMALGQGIPLVSASQDHGRQNTLMHSQSTKEFATHSAQNMIRPISDPSFSQNGQPVAVTQIGFENIVAEESLSRAPRANFRAPNFPTRPPMPEAQHLPQREKLFTPSPPPAAHAPPPTSRSSPKFGVPEQKWECSHCTYINEAGTRVCVICDRTSDNPNLVPRLSSNPEDLLAPPGSSDQLEESVYLSAHETLSEGGVPDMELFNVNTEQLARVQNKIVEEQDQVFLEKKEAHKQFNRSKHRHPSPSASLVQSSSSPPSASPPPLPPRELVTPIPPKPTPPPRRPSDKRVLSQSSSVESRHNSQSHTDPPTYVQTQPGQAENVTGREAGALGDLDSVFLPEGDFSMTMERFSEQKQTKQLQLDGADLMHYVKMADHQGYQMEEMQTALLSSKGDHKKALNWLHTDWPKLIDVVVASTRAEGQKLDHNNIGELSTEEAKSALRTSKGNMVAAVQICAANRKKLYQRLNSNGVFAREEVLQAMLQCCGDEEKARQQLHTAVLQPFLDRVWARRDREGEVASNTLLQLAMTETACHSVSTSVISHADFQNMIMDQNVDRDRRIRMILVEGKLKSWGRADMVIKLLDVDLPKDYPPTNQNADQAPPYSLEDVVEAVRNCRDRQSARVYLTQECSICYSLYPMSKIRNLNFCQCKICQDCLKQNFEVVIREKHVRHWTCPICSLPDLNNHDIATEYLAFLALVLQTQMDKEVLDLFETKVRDWHLQKNHNFRWCAHCGNGFIADEHHLRMVCPHCGDKTCYSCKKQWEDQHDGLTCDQFAQWKIDNDPNNQAVGLARHLEENGIDCPSCKMRYALAKGGCMHFKCPQCGHEFCSGCCQPFYQRGMCSSHHCKMGGLHAHHPRDCFFYLRDEDVDRLQSLLRESNVAFNTIPPDNQNNVDHCPVIEQKEFDSGKSDESCDKDTQQGHAGLCVGHYKEYLVGLINKNHIDPVLIMTVEELKNVLKRSEIACPKVSNNESEPNFRKRLAKFVRDKIPLPSRGP